MHPLNGLLLIDKPSGLTSHDVVHKVRRILGLRAIGHAGTLDPLASGLLILLLGEATKVSDYLLNGDKGYELKARLGLATDSMDITGQVLAEKPVTVTEAEVSEAAHRLVGDLELEVPVHSAVKVGGQKLYELAHRGERPETVPSRIMRFYDLKVLETGADFVRVHMRCSKGSFIRAWANELGRGLGCGATVAELRRTHSEPFTIESAIGLEELERRWEARSERHGREMGPAWIPLRDALPHFRCLEVDGRDETLLKNGQISVGVRAQLMQLIQIVQGDQTPPPVRVVARETDDLLALLMAEPQQFYRIKRVFHRA